MNRYKRSAARSEQQTFNNTDDGIYFVTNNGSNPKVPNIISRNQSRRSVSNSTTSTTASTACLTQNQQIVEENVPLQQQLLVEQQLPGIVNNEVVQEVPLQEVTSEQHVQIIQQDENSGLMYFLLEDGTLAQLDTSALQFDGQQQQFVDEEIDMDNQQQQIVKEELCPPPSENEMMVVDSEQQLVPESNIEQQLVVEQGQEIENHIQSSQQEIEPIITDQQHQTIIGSEPESNFCQSKQNVDSIHQQQILELCAQETQPLNLDDLEEQVNDQKNGELLLLHQTMIDSSPDLRIDQKQMQVMNANQQHELNLKQHDVFNANMEPAPDLIQQDGITEQPIMLAGTSQIKLEEDEKQVQGIEHDGNKQQDEEQNQNPDQEAYFLLRINGQTLLLPMSSLSEQGTLLDNNQEITITEQYSSTDNQSDSNNVPEITTSSNNSLDSSSLIQPVANSVPSDDVSVAVNMASDDCRPKPYRFVLPSQTNADSNSELLIKVEGNSSDMSATTAHRQSTDNDIQDDVNEQPPMKRFKSQSEDIKTESFRTSSIIRPGAKIVPKSKAKTSNPCIFRCGACHKLFPTKELALAHMVEIHKADPRTTRTEFRSLESPKHQNCPKCGIFVQSLHQHICSRATPTMSSLSKEKSRTTSGILSRMTSTAAVNRFDSCMKAKLNQLEIDKKSDSRIPATTYTHQSASVTAVIGGADGSLKESSAIPHFKSTISSSVEDKSSTTTASVQNSFKLRTTPSPQLNFPSSVTCCERTFVDLYYYLQHRLIHTRELNSSDPWQCEVCQVEFGTKPELLSHFFSHNSDYTLPRKQKSGTTPKESGKEKHITSVQQNNSSEDMDQSSDDAPQQATNKRRRGRPSRQELPAHNSDDITTQKRKPKTVVATVQKGVGKLKQATSAQKNNSLEDMEESDDSTPPQPINNKRQRGRPAKQESPPRNSTYTATRNRKSKIVATTVQKEVVKTRRATKVQVSNSSEDMDQSSNDTSQQTTNKRKRGRPSRAQPSTDSNTDIKVNKVEPQPKQVVSGSVASLVSSVVVEEPVKKVAVKTSALGSRKIASRHREELMRMRTPASQKRVQDSFVEIFKRVNRNSAEESINRNGGGSGKPAKFT